MLLANLLLFSNFSAKAQIAGWDFTGAATPATFAATTYNANLDASNLITRGATAAASAGANSFRTTGFQNNGISIANTDFFQITLSAGTGYTMSLSTIDARLAGTAGFTGSSISFSLAQPVFTAPSFTWSAAISLALPLFVVTMTSQNLPGVAAIQAAGYANPPGQTGGEGIPISKMMTLTGLATLVLAPFGAFALNLSAITAAICMGREAHPNPERRYTAAVSCGFLYVLIGLFGAAITGALSAFPKELIAAIAGLALLGTIGSALATAVRDELHREAALITFLVTLSGVTLAGIGSAFWGVVAGALALFVQQYGKSHFSPPSA